MCCNQPVNGSHAISIDTSNIFKGSVFIIVIIIIIINIIIIIIIIIITIIIIIKELLGYQRSP